MIDVAVIALTFAAIFVVELPDKTFIATLVMSTKMRPLFVWIVRKSLSNRPCRSSSHTAPTVAWPHMDIS